MIASCGSSRTANILHYGYVQPKPLAKENLNNFVTSKFIPAMRKNFIDAGIDMKEDGEVAENDGGILISVKGELYAIQSDYSWDTDIRGVYAMGSGGDIALGALAALGISKVTTLEQAKRIVRKAIAIAIEYDMYCSEPIHIFTQVK